MDTSNPESETMKSVFTIFKHRLFILCVSASQNFYRSLSSSALSLSFALELSSCGGVAAKGEQCGWWLLPKFTCKVFI